MAGQTVSITKGDVIDQALRMLGVYGIVLEPEPEDKDYCLNQLEMMITSWNGRGVNVGFILADNIFNASMSEEAGIFDTCMLTVTSNLAKLVCSYFNKSIPPLLNEFAEREYNHLLVSIPPIVMQNEMQPTGAGDRYYYQDSCYNFMTPDVDPVDDNCDL